MTYDGAALTLYVNGNVDGSMAVSRPVNQGSAPFRVGGLNYGPWYFNGMIDELYLFDRALSQGEIQTLMVPEPAAASLLLLLWAMAAVPVIRSSSRHAKPTSFICDEQSTKRR